VESIDHCKKIEGTSNLIVYRSGKIIDQNNGNFLNTYEDDLGELRVVIKKADGGISSHLLKCIVFKAFEGYNPPKQRGIVHKDGDKRNCSIYNLKLSDKRLNRGNKDPQKKENTYTWMNGDAEIFL